MTFPDLLWWQIPTVESHLRQEIPPSSVLQLTIIDRIVFIFVSVHLCYSAQRRQMRVLSFLPACYVIQAFSNLILFVCKIIFFITFPYLSNRCTDLLNKYIVRFVLVTQVSLDWWTEINKQYVRLWDAVV